MTRKHFNAIAEIIKNHVDSFESGELDEFGKTFVGIWRVILRFTSNPIIPILTVLAFLPLVA